MGCLQDLHVSAVEAYSAVLNCGVGPVGDMRGKYHTAYVPKSRIALIRPQKIRSRPSQGTAASYCRKPLHVAVTRCYYGLPSQADSRRRLTALAQIRVPENARSHRAPRSPGLREPLQLFRRG